MDSHSFKAPFLQEYESLSKNVTIFFHQSAPLSLESYASGHAVNPFCPSPTAGKAETGYQCQLRKQSGSQWSL